MDFTGLSAFPLTPLRDGTVDLDAFERLVERIAVAGAQSIGALGSTGHYAYLSLATRALVAQHTVSAASGIPVMVGIGALSAEDARRAADGAQSAGAAAVMLAPVSYQPLTDDEVFELFDDIASRVSVPLCVYDNPDTTHFSFTDDLHGSIAALPTVGAVKFPPPALPDVPSRMAQLRELLPADVALGISGDPVAPAALAAGADVWFSVTGGLFPDTAHQVQSSGSVSPSLERLWDLFAAHGSVRVVATAAAILGLAAEHNLPDPLRELSGRPRDDLVDIVRELR